MKWRVMDVGEIGERWRDTDVFDGGVCRGGVFSYGARGS